MTMTLEQAIQMIDHLVQQVNLLNNQVTQLTTRATSADEEHKQMHAELRRTQGQFTQANTGGNWSLLVDLKTMVPDTLRSSKSPWSQWAEDTRAYVAMLSPLLAQQLKRSRG